MAYPAWKATMVRDGITETFVHTDKDAARNVFWVRTQDNDLPMDFRLELIQVAEVPS